MTNKTSHDILPILCRAKAFDSDSAIKIGEILEQSGLTAKEYEAMDDYLLNHKLIASSWRQEHFEDNLRWLTPKGMRSCL